MPKCRPVERGELWFTTSLGNGEHGSVDQADISICILVAQLARAGSRRAASLPRDRHPYRCHPATRPEHLDAIAGESSSPPRPGQALESPAAPLPPPPISCTFDRPHRLCQVWRRVDPYPGSAPQTWLRSLVACPVGSVGMARCSQAKAARSRPVASKLVFERLADQLGHGRATLGRHLAQPLDDVFGCDDGGAAHDIIMAYVP